MLPHFGQASGLPSPAASAQPWRHDSHLKCRIPAQATTPPLMASALPWTSASATLRLAESTILPKVARETPMRPAAPSW
jgi:hypothetical protein